MKFYGLIFVLCFATFSTCSPVGKTNKAIEVKVFGSASEFFKKYPNAQPIEATHNDDGKAVFEYGARVNHDKLMASASDVYTAPSRQDAAIDFNYPGEAPYSITYAKFTVQQDSGVGKVYIVSGGEGQTSLNWAIVSEGIKEAQYTYDIYSIVYV